MSIGRFTRFIGWHEVRDIWLSLLLCTFSLDGTPCGECVAYPCIEDRGGCVAGGAECVEVELGNKVCREEVCERAEDDDGQGGR